MTLTLLLQQQPNLTLVLALLLGAVIGSFLSVVIHRLPGMMIREWQQECQALSTAPPTTNRAVEEESLALPRSRCPHCRHPLRIIDNLPLLGFLLNRGRCHHCGEAISWRYPLLELLAMGVAVSTWFQFGPTITAVVAALVGWALLALLFIDLDHQLLPDSLTQPLLWGGVICNQWGLFTTPSSALWGAVSGYLTFWTLFQLYHRVAGRHGMGAGDFKLLGALGAWCGWEALPQIVLLSALSALLVTLPLLLWSRQRNDQPDSILTTAIPFGPFLAGAGWFTLLFGIYSWRLPLPGVGG